MKRDVLIIGQGLSGSVLAWYLKAAGLSLVVVDAGEETTSSKIAAGLMTPVTGRRMTVSPEFVLRFHAAVNFYRRIEAVTQRSFLDLPETVRLFQDSDEAAFFRDHREAELRAVATPLNDERDRVAGFRMSLAARLRVSEFLDTTAEVLRSAGELISERIEFSSDLIVMNTGVSIPRFLVEADLAVFCTGFASGTPNPWFPKIPDSPARGDILTVRIPGLNESRVVHRGCWLVPLGDDHYLLGATYDWTNLTCESSPAGRDELLRRLRGITPLPAEVVSHRAAVRPAMTNQQPAAAFHDAHPRLAVFNGFGTKGALLIPEFAAAFVDEIKRRCQPPGERHLAASPQATSATAPSRRSLTKLAHELLTPVIQPGETVIDATAGNGYDTMFLAARVGPAGRVIAFDIQSAAIARTRERFAEQNLSCVELHQRSHAEIGAIALTNESVAAVMFNLGYLPGGDKSVTTEAWSSVEAIRQSLPLLRPRGVLTVIAYRGHAGGLNEAQAVEQLLRATDSPEYVLTTIPADDRNPASPVLFIVERHRHQFVRSDVAG